MGEVLIAMSKKELTRLEVVQRVTGKQMGYSEAARLLSLTERQVKRLVSAFRREGAVGLVSKRRGQPSNNRIDEAIRAEVLGRLRGRYCGFGSTLAAEYLRDEGFCLSKETLRGWMMEAGLWQAGKKKRAGVHPPRERRQKLGELVQIDGSPHDWFEGRGPRCTLIAFIDDASSRVMAACFTPAETTQNYLNGLHAYVLAYGCPAALYSDLHGIFTKHAPEDAEPTQFQRATAELGIATLQALTPQAKGRIERLFQTLQDRLVKAMRLAGISDMEAANGFLASYLIDHNARFAVPPADDGDAHAPYTLNEPALARACAIQQQRKLDKNLTLSFKRQRYIIQTDTPRYALRRQTVTVVEYPDGRIELLHNAEILPFKVFDQVQPIIAAVDDKTLNVRVDELIKQRLHQPRAKPHSEHPWRKPYNPNLLLAAQLSA